jgi:sugar/nucleoside kinase (ribokinase family)
MPEKSEVVVAGHICLDIITSLDGGHFTLSPGRLLQIGAPTLATGGAVSNTGLAMHKLGVKTRLMAKIGSDWIGRIVLELVRKSGQLLVEDIIETREAASSYSIILSTACEDRMILHHPGCNDVFGAEDVDYDVVAASRLFHFGYPPLMKKIIEHGGIELVEVFRRAKAVGVTTSLDMCMPDPHSFSGSVDWESILCSTLPYVDVFMPSLEETLFMLRREIFDSLSSETTDPLSRITPDLVMTLAQELLSMGPQIVGLKSGYLGLYLRTADRTVLPIMPLGIPQDLGCWSHRELWSPCFETNVVGTAGAGDATVAGFLASLARGLRPEDAATVACAVGACSVQALDALSGLRTWDETLAQIAQGWRRKSLPISLTGWVHNESKGVWYGPDDLNSFCQNSEEAHSQ